MSGPLHDLLSALDVDVSAEELADALWLRNHLPSHVERFDRRAEPGVPERTPPRGSAPTPADGAPPASPPPQTNAPSPPAQAGLFLAAPPEGRWTGDAPVSGGTRADVPAASALPHRADLVRALRPFRRRTPSRSAKVLDESATADRIADTGVWLPELRPFPDRWLELVLIVDAGPSMAVWQETIEAFHTLTRQLGAFQNVRVLRLDSSAADHVSLRADGTAWHPGRLLGRTRQRLILVLSDCVGPAWESGTVTAQLEDWGRTSATAVVHMLPQRLWRGCPVSFLPVRLSRRGLDPVNSALRVRMRDGSPWPGGVPVPVVELEPRWMAPWAALMTGGMRDPLPAMALCPAALQAEGDVSADAAWRQDGTAEGRVTPRQRIERFRRRASPSALRLALHLSAVPLNLPVMRLVQQSVLPGSRPADLAEILLGGLLFRTSGTGEATTGPSAVEFEFHNGVRELLLGGISRADALRVWRQGCEYVSRRMGSEIAFPALMAAPGTDETMRISRPFAAVAISVLNAVGGRYRELAERIAEAPADAPLPGLPFAGPRTLTANGAEPRTSGVRRIEPSAGGGEMSIPTPEPAPSSASAGDPATWRGVPPRNPNFTGREKLLLELRGQLKSSVTALLPHALHGMGGVGKTQIALEYIYRFADDYDLICWIPAAEPAQTRDALAGLAEDLGVPHGGDVARTVDRVLQSLRRGTPYRRWLLVFDNADSVEAVQPYLPASGGHIIVTSRNPGWLDIAQAFEVNVFNREESIRLLQARGQDMSDADADRLATMLGDLPIAIEQAASWQAQSGMPVAVYLKLLEERLEQILSENKPRGYPAPVVAAWGFAFDRLEERSQPAAQLLLLCSFFGAEPIPYDLLRAGRFAPGLSADLADILRDDILFHRAIRTINRFAMLKVDAARETIQEHRLMQAVLRGRLDADEQEAFSQAVRQMLATANPGRPDDPVNWPRLRQINRHIGAVRLVEEAASVEVRRVVIDQMRYLYAIGDYESSRELGERTMLDWWRRFGPDDGQVLIFCRHMCTTWRAVGLTDVARAYNVDTMERMRRVFGSDHEHTLVVANSYAADLRMADEYAEAYRLDTELLERHKEVFGENDENTLRSANNLAVDLRLAGEFERALELDRRTWRQRIDVLGSAALYTCFSAVMVARDLRSLGRYAESLQVFEENLPAAVERFGGRHPVVVRMRIDHGATLRRIGRIEEAARELEECVALNLQLLGESHSYTLTGMTQLADVRRLLGDHDSARQMEEQVATLAPAVYGAHHSSAAMCEHNYAIKLRIAGSAAEAVTLDQRVNARFRELLGPDDQYTLCSDASLAADLSRLGEHDEAVRTSADLLERSRTVRGSEHPLTLSCAVNLALDRLARGDPAEPIFADAVAALRQCLGNGHPEVRLAQERQRLEFDVEIPDR